MITKKFCLPSIHPHNAIVEQQSFVQYDKSHNVDVTLRFQMECDVFTLVFPIFFFYYYFVPCSMMMNLNDTFDFCCSFQFSCGISICLDYLDSATMDGWPKCSEAEGAFHVQYKYNYSICLVLAVIQIHFLITQSGQTKDKQKTAQHSTVQHIMCTLQCAPLSEN